MPVLRFGDLPEPVHAALRPLTHTRSARFGKRLYLPNAQFGTTPTTYTVVQVPTGP
jgi:hypothetical protein